MAHHDRGVFGLAEGRECAECHNVKGKEEFSQNQWRKKYRGRCVQCIATAQSGGQGQGPTLMIQRPSLGSVDELTSLSLRNSTDLMDTRSNPGSRRSSIQMTDSDEAQQWSQLLQAPRANDPRLGTCRPTMHTCLHVCRNHLPLTSPLRSQKRFMLQKSASRGSNISMADGDDARQWADLLKPGGGGGRSSRFSLNKSTSRGSNISMADANAPPMLSRGNSRNSNISMGRPRGPGPGALSRNSSRNSNISMADTGAPRPLSHFSSRASIISETSEESCNLGASEIPSTPPRPQKAATMDDKTGMLTLAAPLVVGTSPQPTTLVRSLVGSAEEAQLPSQKSPSQKSTTRMTAIRFDTINTATMETLKEGPPSPALTPATPFSLGPALAPSADQTESDPQDQMMRSQVFALLKQAESEKQAQLQYQNQHQLQQHQQQGAQKAQYQQQLLAHQQQQQRQQQQQQQQQQHQVHVEQLRVHQLAAGRARELATAMAESEAHGKAQAAAQAQVQVLAQQQAQAQAYAQAHAQAQAQAQAKLQAHAHQQAAVEAEKARAHQLQLHHHQQLMLQQQQLAHHQEQIKQQQLLLHQQQEAQKAQYQQQLLAHQQQQQIEQLTYEHLRRSSAELIQDPHVAQVPQGPSRGSGTRIGKFRVSRRT